MQTAADQTSSITGQAWRPAAAGASFPCQAHCCSWGHTFHLANLTLEVEDFGPLICINDRLLLGSLPGAPAAASGDRQGMRMPCNYDTLD